MKPTKPTRKEVKDVVGRIGTDSPAAPNGEAAAAQSPNSDESLLDAAAGISRLHAFSAAIHAAGLAEVLGGDGPLTIFAPTDRAFEKLPSGELAALLNDKSRLADVLRHHVVPGRVKAPGERRPRSVTPQFGDKLRLTSETGSYHVDEARIVKTNIRAMNGVIHAIDTVLIPR